MKVVGMRLRNRIVHDSPLVQRPSIGFSPGVTGREDRTRGRRSSSERVFEISFFKFRVSLEQLVSLRGRRAQRSDAEGTERQVDMPGVDVVLEATHWNGGGDAEGFGGAQGAGEGRQFGLVQPAVAAPQEQQKSSVKQHRSG